MINIRNLTKSYGKNKGIKDFTFSFEKGTVYGLIGPNGAGKTTLIKCITNMISKDSGEIEKNFENNELLYNISYMPDFNYFVPGSVKKNIDFFKISYDDINMEVLEDLLTKFQIDFSDKVRKLSTGKQKALKFSLCVSRDTKVYVLDEPFSGIDVVTRKRICDDIINVVDLENSLMIISSHELHDMDSILDHIVLLDHANMKQSIDVESIKHDNQSLYDWFIAQNE